METLPIFCILAFIVILTSAFLAAGIRVVPENKRLKVYRLGEYLGEKGPGLVLLIPIIDRGVWDEMGNPVPSAGENQTDDRGNVIPR